MTRKNIRQKEGFTLIEVMIVVSIIALVLILSYVAYSAQLAKGNDAKRKSDIYEIKFALESYEKDKDCYPTFLPNCDPGDEFKPYIEKIPCEPEINVNYVYYPEPSACPQWYWIFTQLDYENDSKIDELGCSFGCGPTSSLLDFDYYQTSPNAPEPVKGDAPPEEPPDSTPASGYYGCFDGACLPISWDPDRPGPECDPNFTTATCGNPTLCINPETGLPQYECNPI
jgi:prepilin-type N-terminal cleavage/methylation domain-containing protein